MATLPSIRAVMCQGAPSARASRTSHSDSAVGDEVADHRDQPDDAVDAVADLGAGHDEGDVEQLRDRVEPRQPLLAGEIAERIGIAEIEADAVEASALKLRTERFLGDFAALLIDDRAARPCPAETMRGRFFRARAGLGARYFFVRHRHHMGNAQGGRKLRQAVAPSRLARITSA